MLVAFGDFGNQDRSTYYRRNCCFSYFKIPFQFLQLPVLINAPCTTNLEQFAEKRKKLTGVLLPKSCRIGVEGPERSEDLERIAGTNAAMCTLADSPNFKTFFQCMFYTVALPVVVSRKKSRRCFPAP